MQTKSGMEGENTNKMFELSRDKQLWINLRLILENTYVTDCEVLKEQNLSKGVCWK